MSEWYNNIYAWFNSTPQKWNIDRVWNAVGKGKITAEEYLEITGYIYPAKGPEEA